jgi:3'(2'), 5'-bisphosphate nucleotidase
VLEAIDSPDASSPTDGAAESQGFWALDPIDGTKGYLRGQQYAVCLAYIEFGTPVVAVMGCPNLPRDFSAPLDGRDPVGTMYFAIRGDGLFETGCAGDRRDGRPVRISRLEHDPEEPITICEAVEVSRRDSQGAAAIVSHLGAGAAVLRLDSQCKYAVVARGQADAFIRLPGSGEKGDWIWDRHRRRLASLRFFHREGDDEEPGHRRSPWKAARTDHRGDPRVIAGNEMTKSAESHPVGRRVRSSTALD